MAVTGLITLEEAKAYLRIDGNEEDDLIARLIASSERLCLDILRKEEPEETAAFKMAVLFSVAYLYEHREDADYHNLLLTALSFVWGKEGSLLMKIGKMDKRITLFRPIPTEDGYGGFQTDYEEMGQIWAQVIQTNYAEQEAQGTPMNREQLRLKIRPRKDIRRGWRLRLFGEIYEIETVDNTYRDSTTLIVHRYEQGV